MYRELYNKISKEIKSVISEQFNINDLDFSDDDHGYDVNIFNKECNHPYYYKILNNTINKKEITELNKLYCVAIAEDKEVLKKIVTFYSDKYPSCSMNWLDVSLITDMSQLFGIKNNDNTHDDVIYMYNGDISKWDVSNVTDMSYMFWRCAFNKDISKWDVSNVTNMFSMFGCSRFNNNISDWNVSNVTNMQSMFYHSRFNQDISKWDVSNVTNMNLMFYWSAFNQDISKWDVSNVKNMRYMFMLSRFNQDISNWNVSNVVDYEDIFSDCRMLIENKPGKFR